MYSSDLAITVVLIGYYVVLDYDVKCIYHFVKRWYLFWQGLRSAVNVFSH